MQVMQSYQNHSLFQMRSPKRETKRMARQDLGYWYGVSMQIMDYVVHVVHLSIAELGIWNHIHIYGKRGG
jgi:hypothetical protein